MNRWIGIFAAGLAAVPTSERVARACGCFAQPNPVQRVVQAGERIVFAQRGSRVEMHVQVNYTGDAESFGWLLPVPNEPSLSPGTDSLFQRLNQTTGRRFGLAWDWSAGCAAPDRGFGNGTGAGGGWAEDGSPPEADAGAGGPSPVVSRQDVGAFDAVVLRADDADAMFDWLNDNEFIVPVGPEDDVVQRYLGPGNFFVALKLQANRTTGDIQPIILEFDAGGPMIPITLTRVGAVPDLPVVVYVFADDRAIPRNYRHTEINLEHIDWFSGGGNYESIVTAAVDEAEGAHSFVTEYAGSNAMLQDAFSFEGRFGDRSEFETVTDARELLDTLNRTGFDQDAKLANLLRTFVPYPEEQASMRGITEDDFYGLIFFYLGPSGPFDATTLPVDGNAVADALWAEIVEPSKRAEALVEDFGKVTRLFTTLSPEEMTVDPAFDLATQLPDVGRAVEATFRPVCDERGFFSDQGWLELPDGRRFFTSPSTWRDRAASSDAPFSRRIRALYADRPPVDLVDNTDSLTASDPASAAPEPAGSSGCTSTGAPWAVPLFAVVAILGDLRRRRGASLD